MHQPKDANINIYAVTLHVGLAGRSQWTSAHILCQLTADISPVAVGSGYRSRTSVQGPRPAVRA